jgi:mannose-1-phosphate guanylyltransferase/mannose-6-phosphate isomerase
MIVVIMSGGSGSRLWPVSREQHPKPFIRLPDGQSLLQKAFLRGAQLPGVRHVMTVTNRDHFFKTEDDYREIASPSTQLSFVLEPFGRNTAAAIAAAVLEVIRLHGEEETMLVLAADHLISDQVAFASAVSQASGLATQGQVVTFGIRPSAPETGYGYIEADGNRVIRFVEKPDLRKATEYFSSGKYLWNAGMFCFKAGVMRDQMAIHCPTVLDKTSLCLARSRLTEGANFSQVELDAFHFSDVPEDSIDYAVMEKSSQIAVVPCDIGWSDIGSWTALGDLTDEDANGNRVSGQALMHDTQNCTIQADRRMVGTVGVRDLVIVDTADALLVAHKDKAQDVKHLFSALKSMGHAAHKTHSTAHRPWGTYTVLEEGPGFKIKRIEVKPGASLSLQLHHHRSEHWVVVSGEATVTNGEQELHLKTNESTYIPAEHKHRLENLGAAVLVMIEVQTGTYLGEDDIVRFADRYGRTN